MKKVLTLVLTLAMVIMSSMTAFAASPISLTAENMGRGGTLATINADGSVTSAKSNVSFYLPTPVKSGETVTVTVKGSCDSDFRVWLIDVNETTNSDQYVMSANGFTKGDFDVTFDLTATAEGTEIFFKGPTFDTPITNLTITSLDVQPKGAAAATTTVAADTTDAATTAAPKTGETSNNVLWFSLAAVAMAGYVIVTKKSAAKNEM